MTEDQEETPVPAAAPPLSLVELYGPLITLDEYARLVRRHRDTVYGWHRDPAHTGPKGTLVGGKLLFVTAEIERYWADLHIAQHGRDGGRG
jgi:hypothetical protein